MKTKPFIAAFVRDLDKQLSIGEISYSRMVELLNERAFEFFAQTTTKDKLTEIVKPLHRHTDLFEMGKGEWVDVDKVIEVLTNIFSHWERTGFYDKEKKPARTHTSPVLDEFFGKYLTTEEENKQLVKMIDDVCDKNDQLKKELGNANKPEGKCCMTCFYWRPTQNGLGECSIFEKYVEEDFYCKSFTKK